MGDKALADLVAVVDQARGKITRTPMGTPMTDVVCTLNGHPTTTIVVLV
jgi:hypothetical protein